MKQPFSTFTNLAYIAVGFWIMPYAIVLGASLILLGVGSGGYHYHNQENRVWQRRDVYAMYIVLLSFIYTFLGGGLLPFIFLFLSGGILVYFERDFSSFKTIPVLFFIILSLHVSSGGSLLSMVFFLIGLVCNIPHIRESELTKKNDILHGLWHIFTALGFLYLYFDFLKL